MGFDALDFVRDRLEREDSEFQNILSGRSIQTAVQSMFADGFLFVHGIRKPPVNLLMWW